MRPGGDHGDLLETLREIEAQAKKARKRLAAGEALNGATAFERIRAQASDAVHRAERTLEVEPAA